MRGHFWLNAIKLQLNKWVGVAYANELSCLDASMTSNDFAEFGLITNLYDIEV